MIECASNQLEHLRAHELQRPERRKRYLKEQRSDTAGPSHSLGANSPKCFAWMFVLHLAERIATVYRSVAPKRAGNR